MIGLTCDFRCCTPCYPAPSDLFTKLVSRVADDMEADLNSRHRNTGPVLKADSYPPSNTTAPLEIEIRLLVEICQQAHSEHLKAISFMSQYGTLFRKYDGPHRYSEVLNYTHTILFSMVVGFLKRYTKEQALAAFGLWFSLLCYYAWACPYNEYLRNHLEIGSVSCVVTALGFMVLHVFDVIEDIGDVVTYLFMGSVGFKVSYQLCVLLRTWCRKRRPRSSGDATDDHVSEVPLGSPQSDKANEMPSGSQEEEWTTSRPAFASDHHHRFSEEGLIPREVHQPPLYMDNGRPQN